MKWLLSFLCICALAAFLFYHQANIVINSAHQVNKETIFVISKGDSLKQIAKTLHDADLLDNPLYFEIYARIFKIYPKIKAGEYMVDSDASYVDLAQMLTSGKFYYRKITIPEGTNKFTVRQILEQNEFLSGDVPNFAEGEIMPETYTFLRGESRAKIIANAKKNMSEQLQKIWQQRDTSLPIKSAQELLIMASIVEKETSVAKERADVASVFYNRLNRNMKLQTDPTVIYALTHGEKDLGRPLYRRDLEVDDLYNTYKYFGLPPSPICNPGKEALLASAHPNKTNYLYFVASGDGGHNFAQNLAEHNKNVGNWRKIKSSN